MATDQRVEVTRFREAQDRWKTFCEPGILDIELHKGLKIQIAGDKISRAKPSKNQVVAWSYHVGESGKPLVLEIVLSEQKKSWLVEPGFYAKLSKDQKAVASTLTAFLRSCLLRSSPESRTFFSTTRIRIGSGYRLGKTSGSGSACSYSAYWLSLCLSRQKYTKVR
jgi:hypothetical protein